MRVKKIVLFVSYLRHCCQRPLCHDWNYMSLLWKIVRVPSTENTLTLSSQRRHSFLHDSWWLTLVPQLHFGLWSFEFSSSDHYEVLQLSLFRAVSWSYKARTVWSWTESCNFALYNPSKITSKGIFSLTANKAYPIWRRNLGRRYSVNLWWTNLRVLVPLHELRLHGNTHGSCTQLLLVVRIGRTSEHAALRHLLFFGSESACWEAFYSCFSCSICFFATNSSQFFNFLAIFCLTFLEESISQFQFSIPAHRLAWWSWNRWDSSSWLISWKSDVRISLFPISRIDFCFSFIQFLLSHSLSSDGHFSFPLKDFVEAFCLSTNAKRFDLDLSSLSIQTWKELILASLIPNTVGTLLAAVCLLAAGCSWVLGSVRVLCGGDYGGVVIVRETPVAIGEVDRRVLVVGMDPDVGPICVWRLQWAEVQEWLLVTAHGVDEAEVRDREQVEDEAFRGKRVKSTPNKDMTEMKMFYETRNTEQSWATRAVIKCEVRTRKMGVCAHKQVWCLQKNSQATRDRWNATQESNDRKAFIHSVISWQHSCSLLRVIWQREDSQVPFLFGEWMSPLTLLNR